VIRRATSLDVALLHALMTIPKVYFYLADDKLPRISIMENWVESSDVSFERSGVGLWMLEERGAPGSPGAS
jgi:hypothetical protein